MDKENVWFLIGYLNSYIDGEIKTWSGMPEDEFRRGVIHSFYVIRKILKDYEKEISPVIDEGSL